MPKSVQFTERLALVAGTSFTGKENKLARYFIVDGADNLLSASSQSPVFY
ncbi:hypothetical protein SMY46_003641 [Cronobacter turicensis]|nr:hypothetical protein [Cronobacter turicensis]EKY3120182.1 hypothetical protein [Cronobacter turicensis]ELU8455572.1 hypothetical protein [Cronobacter turicensis]ELY4111920.1 hypothetical protein [Cronobacter turicensis]ELY4217854.1 hypothetical protein [Cronobacter turicensis]EMA1793099.1 hypothetical protein [Cronobacter turicensis]